MQANGRWSAYCAIKLFKYNLQLIAFHSGEKKKSPTTSAMLASPSFNCLVKPGSEANKNLKHYVQQQQLSRSIPFLYLSLLQAKSYREWKPYVFCFSLNVGVPL